MLILVRASSLGFAFAVGWLAIVLTAAPLNVVPSTLEVTGNRAHAEPGEDSERARQTAFEHTRERYRRARGRAPDVLPSHAPKAVVELTPEETEALIANGWQSREAAGAGFDDHGERTRTMVELARRMGYEAWVGALQARFGTPYESGIASLEAEIARTEARLGADPGNLDLAAERSRLEAERRHLIQTAGPGRASDAAWATVDLDANRDGRVDRHDLTALDQSATTQPAGYRAGVNE